MTIDMTHHLPAVAPTPYVKPTLANTKGGKLYRPTHPDSFRVVFEAPPGAKEASGVKDAAGAEHGEEEFSSKLVAVKSFAPGETIAVLENISAAPAKAYSSVQYGPGEHDHLELNSDLLFMNHSCAPSALISLPPPPGRWLVRAGPAGIPSGGDITFFYPSTEWDMAQGFECGCGADKCLGRIQGAKYLTMEQLDDRGEINAHVRAMKAEQDRE